MAVLWSVDSSPPLGLLKLGREGVKEETLYIPKPADWPFREV